jgi:hypothetical protein
MVQNCGCQKRCMRFNLKAGAAKVDMSHGVAKITGNDIEFNGGSAGDDDESFDCCGQDSDLEPMHNSEWEEMDASMSGVEAAIVDKSEVVMNKVESNWGIYEADVKKMAKNIIGEVTQNVVVSTISKLLM